jgi:murein DD-endopeptidase MepM/ murein hydrolase activator NlpD
MNIILISSKMAKAKTLDTWQICLFLMILVSFPIILTLLFITPKDSIKEQGVKAMLPPNLKGSIISNQSHLDAYAKQIGELQARIMRLDAQNLRLAKLAGDKTLQKEGKVNNKPEMDTIVEPEPNRGGPLIHPKHMTEQDLQAAIQELVAAVDERDDYQSLIESKVLQQSVLKEMLPNISPVRAGYNSSSYGWRIDPFNGQKAFHEGLDFPASEGVSIRAAGDGIVIAALRTEDYGNLVKINHGSGLETRYAHASKILVKVGDRVAKGQVIAEVGSTGRSTGPHLHYEIRLNGSALDPRQYLYKNLS